MKKDTPSQETPEVDVVSLDEEDDDFFSQTRDTIKRQTMQQQQQATNDPFAGFTDLNPKGRKIEAPPTNLMKSAGVPQIQHIQINSSSRSRYQADFQKNAFFQEMQEQIEEASSADDVEDYFDTAFRDPIAAKKLGSVAVTDTLDMPKKESNPMAQSQMISRRSEALFEPRQQNRDSFNRFIDQQPLLTGRESMQIGAKNTGRESMTLGGRKQVFKEKYILQKTEQIVWTEAELFAILVQDGEQKKNGGNSELFVSEISMIDDYFVRPQKYQNEKKAPVSTKNNVVQPVQPPVRPPPQVQQPVRPPVKPYIEPEQTPTKPPVKPYIPEPEQQKDEPVQHQPPKPQVQPVQPPTKPQVQPVQPPTKPQVQPVQSPTKPQVQPVQPPTKPQVQPVQPPIVKPQVQPVQPPPPTSNPVQQPPPPVAKPLYEVIEPEINLEPASQVEDQPGLPVTESPPRVLKDERPEEDSLSQAIESPAKVDDEVEAKTRDEEKPQVEITEEIVQSPELVIDSVQQEVLEVPKVAQQPWRQDAILPSQQNGSSFLKADLQPKIPESPKATKVDSPKKQDSPKMTKPESPKVQQPLDTQQEAEPEPDLPKVQQRQDSESEDEELFANADADTPLDKNNYLRYISDSAFQQQNLLDIVSKNERAYKQAAERLMQTHSQLALDANPTIVDEQLMAATPLKGIASVIYKPPYSLLPMCIGSCEDFVCVGFSEGSLRLFNFQQTELKQITDKSVKNNAITCLDIQRLEKTQNLYIVCGHAKGHISLFEIVKFSQVESGDLKMEFKHRKTVDDVHKAGVIQVRFIGDLRKERVVASCDVDGKVCITTFIDSYVAYRTSTQILQAPFKIGPAFSIRYCNHLLMKLERPEPVIDTEKESLKEEMTRKLKDKLEKHEKVTIIGLGTLNEVFMCKVKPQMHPLLHFRKPAFVPDGTVPYLDWGLALTPSHRDRAYPCQAVAWGTVLQLIVFTNEVEANAGTEQPLLQCDGYYITNCESIDQVLFLSESLVFILVNKKEIKILYTQNFTPGCFNESYFTRDFTQQQISEDSESQLEYFKEQKKKFGGSVAAYAEKDGGYPILDGDEVVAFDNMPPGSTVQPHNNLNTSVARNQGFNIVCLGQNSVVLQSLIHWEDYIDIVKQTSQDNKTVLTCVLDIFFGKMVGLAGLPDQLEKRQVLMQDRIHALIKQNVNACIKEFKAGDQAFRKTLGLTIEFCMKIGATDDIFGDLFDIFVFHDAEQMYFEGLHPFILSGKLKKQKLSEQLLQKLMEHYKSKNDPQVLEQVLVSVDMTRSQVIDEVRLLCEDKQLSSALVHIMKTILTSEEDKNTACLSILIGLFNMMKKSQTTATQREIQNLTQFLKTYPTSLFELSREDGKADLSEAKFQNDRKIKIAVEHSSTYVGYKILWLISLLLEGSDYPQGSLDQLRWRYYTVDIVTFLTNEGFATQLLDQDPESFFQILKKLFNDHDTYQIIDSHQEFLDANKSENPLLKPCATHAEILMTFDQVVQQIIDSEKEQNEGKMTLKAETLQNAFVSFLTQIAKNQKIDLPKQVCYTLLKNQINFYRQILKIPKSELKSLSQTKSIYSSLVKKNERDILAVFKQPNAIFSKAELNQLLQLSQETHLYKLTVLLNQLLGDYEVCFILYFNNKAIKAEIFTWLQEFQHQLNTSNYQEQTDDQWEARQKTFNQMKALVGKQLIEFTKMDPTQTVKLVDYWFDRDYLQIAELLKGTRQTAFEFLVALLQENQEQIMADYSTSILQNKTTITNRYKHVLLRLCELLAEDKVLRNKSLTLEELVSREYFPIDEAIRICEKYQREEALAVLYKRQGKLMKSVELYIKLMQALCIKSIIIQAVHEENINFQQCSARSLKEFDRMLMQIVEICVKSSVKLLEAERTQLWMESIKGLFEIGREVEVAQMFKSTPIRNRISSKIPARHEDSVPDVPLKFEKFLLIRNQYFLAVMSEHVNLVSIISVLESTGYNLKYDDFRSTFEEKIETDSYFMFILQAAISFTEKQSYQLRSEYYSALSRGFLQNKRNCDQCGLQLVSKFNTRELVLLKCSHVFHTWCLAKESVNGNLLRTCNICHNELENFRSFQQMRVKKPMNRPSSQNSLTGSTENSSSTLDQSWDNDHATTQAAQPQQQQQQKKKVERRVKQTRAMNEFEKLLQAENISLRDF